MKAEELMIRDWVLHEGTPKRVDVIWGEREVSLYNPLKVWGSIYADKYDAISVSPLGLTPELLEKNFESEDNMFGYNTYELSQDFAVENRGDRYCLVRKCMSTSTFWICDIQYVHELQHALRFYGIEKNIEL